MSDLESPLRETSVNLKRLKRALLEGAHTAQNELDKNGPSTT